MCDAEIMEFIALLWRVYVYFNHKVTSSHGMKSVTGLFHIFYLRVFQVHTY